MPRRQFTKVEVGRFVRAMLAAAAILLPGPLLPAAQAQPTGSAVEYYHAGFDHYFITSYPNEIALLDGGGFGGAWRRTGQSIPVWTTPGPDTHATCRFFSEAFAPKSSHFYTPYAGECATLQQGTTWKFEAVAFHLRVDSTGHCAPGTAPLYRFYNNARGGAPNHRYTVSRATFDQMVAQGWTAEGAGPQTVFACVPQADDAIGSSGTWYGTTSAGEELVGATFVDGSFYFFYGSPTRLGVIDGRAAFTGNDFATTEARDFVIVPDPGESLATVTGTIVPRSSISGTIVSAQGRRTFVASYEAPPSEPVLPAEVAGAYEGVAATEVDYVELVLTVSPQGLLSGTASGCTVAGAVSARGTTGLFDATITLSGTACRLGFGTTTGIALADPTVDALLVVTRSAGMSDAFVFIGVR